MAHEGGFPFVSSLLIRPLRFWFLACSCCFLPSLYTICVVASTCNCIEEFTLNEPFEHSTVVMRGYLLFGILLVKTHGIIPLNIIKSFCMAMFEGDRRVGAPIWDMN